MPPNVSCSKGSIGPSEIRRYDEERRISFPKKMIRPDRIGSDTIGGSDENNIKNSR